MAGPFGLGYGLAAAGQGLSQGVLNSQIQAPQIQGMMLQNQQRQMEIQQNQQMNPLLLQQEQGKLDLLRRQASEWSGAASSMQEATDPKTGQFDSNKFISLIGQRAPSLFPSVTNTVGLYDTRRAQLPKVQAQTQNLDLKTQQDRAAQLASIGQGLAKYPPGPQRAQALESFIPRLQQMDLPPEFIDQARQNINDDNWLQSQVSAGMDANKQAGLAVKQKQIENALALGMGRVQVGMAGVAARNAATGERAREFNAKPEQKLQSFLETPLEDGGMGLNPPETSQWMNQVQQLRKAGKSTEEIAMDRATQLFHGMTFDQNKFNSVYQNILNTLKSAPTTRPSASKTEKSPLSTDIKAF